MHFHGGMPNCVLQQCQRKKYPKYAKHGLETQLEGILLFIKRGGVKCWTKTNPARAVSETGTCACQASDNHWVTKRQGAFFFFSL